MFVRALTDHSLSTLKHFEAHTPTFDKAVVEVVGIFMGGFMSLVKVC